MPARLPLAFADAGAVKIVVDHLLANAANYSAPDRPIVVSAKSDRRWVRVSVADFGVGMTGDEAARCFEPFWQAAGRRGGGAGIGLYIVRSLVDAMGGHLGVRTAPNKGSTFTFSLPRSEFAAKRANSPAESPGLGEGSVIQEFMRQIGVPNRRGS